MFATPIAWLINEQDVIVHDVAVSTDSIQKLLVDNSATAIPDNMELVQH
jgi:hypothetical protein